MEAARVQTLQRMPIFGALGETSLRLLVEKAPRVEVAAGEPFFREGDPGRAMFVLEAGRVLVTRQWRGREIVLNELGPGDCFGEMALIDLFPRSASVRALTACVAMSFGNDEMLHLFESDAEQFALLQMNLARELCRRLRTTDELLFRATMGESPGEPRTLA